MGYCPSCDEEFEYSDLLCPDCGERLIAEAGDERDADDERHREEADDLQENWGAPEGSTVADSTDDRSDTEEGPRFISDDLVGFIFGYPKRSGWLAPILGGFCLIFFILIIPLFYVFGYTYRIGRSAARGDDSPPPANEWGRILVDGIAIVAIYIAINVVGFSIFAGLEYSVYGTVFEPLNPINHLGNLVVSLIIGSTFLALVGAGDIAETFSGGRFLTIMFTSQYALAVILYIVIQVVMFIALVATGITIIGILLWPFIIAYTFFVEFAMLGYLYNKGAESGAFDPVEPDDSIDLI